MAFLKSSPSSLPSSQGTYFNTPFTEPEISIFGQVFIKGSEHNCYSPARDCEYEGEKIYYPHLLAFGGKQYLLYKTHPFEDYLTRSEEGGSLFPVPISHVHYLPFPGEGILLGSQSTMSLARESICYTQIIGDISFLQSKLPEGEEIASLYIAKSRLNDELQAYTLPSMLLLQSKTGEVFRYDVASKSMESLSLSAPGEELIIRYHENGISYVSIGRNIQFFRSDSLKKPLSFVSILHPNLATISQKYCHIMTSRGHNIVDIRSGALLYPPGQEPLLLKPMLVRDELFVTEYTLPQSAYIDMTSPREISQKSEFIVGGTVYELCDYADGTSDLIDTSTKRTLITGAAQGTILLVYENRREDGIQSVFEYSKQGLRFYTKTDGMCLTPDGGYTHRVSFQPRIIDRSTKKVLNVANRLNISLKRENRDSSRYPEIRFDDDTFCSNGVLHMLSSDDSPEKSVINAIRHTYTPFLERFFVEDSFLATLPHELKATAPKWRSAKKSLIDGYMSMIKNTLLHPEGIIEAYHTFDIIKSNEVVFGDIHLLYAKDIQKKKYLFMPDGTLITSELESPNTMSVVGIFEESYVVYRTQDKLYHYIDRRGTTLFTEGIPSKLNISVYGYIDMGEYRIHPTGAVEIYNQGVYTACSVDMLETSSDRERIKALLKLTTINHIKKIRLYVERSFANSYLAVGGPLQIAGLINQNRSDYVDQIGDMGDIPYLAIMCYLNCAAYYYGKLYIKDGMQRAIFMGLCAGVAALYLTDILQHMYRHNK